MPTYDPESTQRNLRASVERDVQRWLENDDVQEYQRQMMKLMGRDPDAEAAQVKVDSAIEVVANVLAASEELDPDQDAIAVVKALGLAEISIGVAVLERSLKQAERKAERLQEEVRVLRGSVPEANLRRGRGGPIANMIITDEAGVQINAGIWGDDYFGGGVKDKGPVVPAADPPKITQEMAANAIKGARKKRPPYRDHKRRVDVDEYGVEHPY